MTEPTLPTPRFDKLTSIIFCSAVGILAIFCMMWIGGATSIAIVIGGLLALLFYAVGATK